uniref:Ubiquitin-like domain-containing protein n=1 Tax=Pyrodinium bahamense TaxID=73915 RepID=A0A7S0FQM3_9DINO|mmetsp:Transcript_41072/g.114156  ORF Transcript_41072/g.114156 Transcript_41072/m.114156 type:complete len:176 (+) Transcript_41072:185-712(+)
MWQRMIATYDPEGNDEVQSDINEWSDILTDATSTNVPGGHSLQTFTSIEHSDVAHLGELGEAGIAMVARLETGTLFVYKFRDDVHRRNRHVECIKPFFRIFVKMLSGSLIALDDISEADTLSGVKDKIRDKAPDDVQPDQFDLVFEGRQLDDAHVLFHYNIQKDSTLLMKSAGSE